MSFWKKRKNQHKIYNKLVYMYIFYTSFFLWLPNKTIQLINIWKLFIFSNNTIQYLLKNKYKRVSKELNYLDSSYKT